MKTIQINEIHNPDILREVRNLIHGNLYRKGTDPYWYADIPEAFEPWLIVQALNRIPGIRAEVYQAYASLRGARTLH